MSCDAKDEKGGTSGASGSSATSAGATGSGADGSGAAGNEPGGRAEVVYSWGQVGHEGSLRAGEWKVDNSASLSEGETAVHAPVIPPGGEASMTFDCGGEEHTQLGFVVWQRTNETELELFDGKQSRGLVTAGYGGFGAQVIDVKGGVHTYTFTARNLGATESEMPWVLDSFVCKNATPAAGVNGFVSFDKGFVPIELSGDWFVDNMRGQQQGEAAVHPPALGPGEDSSMTFDCAGEEHTQLSFAVWQATNETQLELFDGDQSRGIVTAGYGGYGSQVINVSPGAHTYRLIARNTGTTKIDVPWVLDTFRCKNVTPAADDSGFVDFDDGFVPLEVGGDWLVDNMRGQHEGEAAIHPPALDPSKDSSMTFDCGGVEHSQMKFAVWQATNGTELELFDGKESRGLVTQGYGGFQLAINDVDHASHTYTLTARNISTERIDVPWVVDTFVCQ